MKSRIVQLLVSLVVLATAGVANAAPLSNTQLGVFQTHLECRTRCENAKVATQSQCVSQCNAEADAAGATRSDWDKDRNGATNTVDYELAVLENRDAASGTLICYENQAVVPKNACGLANCTATHTAAQCADVDGDGVRQYQEALIGTSDTVFTKSCAMNSECGGYTAECRWVADANKSLCMDRSCAATNSCTAFHLEQVVQDNNEVLVRVVYDYSPTPATVLDLRVAYSQAALTLVDARPLDGLKRTRKSLSAKQNPAGFVRLVVLSDDNTIPIPFGPIAELLFTRTSSLASTLSFVTDDAVQSMSMAPDPGQFRASLGNDALWGGSIAVRAQDPRGDRMMLSYSFDNPARPLDYNEANPQSSSTGQDLGGALLCDKVASCKALATGSAEKTELIARYNQLQRGVVDGTRFIEGVNGSALFMDGFGNHLELPVTINEPASGSYQSSSQSFSVSTWLYNEGDAKTGTSGQVLLSHNTQSSELTRFGLMVIPQASGTTFDLVFFEGDVTSGSVRKVTVSQGLASRRWTHVGMSVDANARQARFYLNGVAVGNAVALNSTPALACPAFDASGTALQLHNFGDQITGAKTPEGLFFASAQNNLYGIEQMDLNGLSRRTIMRTGDSSSQDPDYHSKLDKVVFASSRTGNYEIWVANGDGSNPVQITTGFGDTARGIFARRPRWAPDGSAIVFESNVYSNEYYDNSTTPATIGDNLRIRGYHLYYVAYDNINNRPAIPMPDGAIASQLTYATIHDAQSLRDYRLTSTETDRHHYDAFWLRGPHSENGVSFLGELVFTRADAAYRNATIGRVQIPSTINTSVPGTLAPFVGNDGSDLRLLTARRGRMQGQTADTTRMLIAKEWKSYDPATQYQLSAPTESNGEITYTVTFNPAGYSATCWDKNLDQICQGEENRNGDQNPNGTNRCDVSDCYPSAIRDLYVAYNPGIVSPRRYVASDGVAQEQIGQLMTNPGAWLGTNGKQLQLGDNPTTGAAYLKVEVVSALNDTPIPAGTQLATLRFTRTVAGSSSIAATQRKIHQQLYVWTDGSTPTAFTVDSADFQEILDARLSPALDRLVLSGIQNARPIVARTASLTGTAGMQKISTAAVRVEGMDWEPVVRVYPCNWVGAYRSPTQGVYAAAFRGALDELKLYSYVRPADAFAAEAARGAERLVKDGRGGSLDAAVGACSSSFDCPAYQVCTAGTCRTTTCNPQAAYPCADGTCTLLPVPLDDGREVAKWVCAVECAADSQCFEQECMNGPCRFCGTGSSCVECRPTSEDLGGITVSYVEGCPDRNSFMCASGSCESECYSFENAQSQYLCDEALEYCHQGRCVLNKWDWPDFAPATFAGLGEMVVEGIPTTIATSQLYPIEIQAYGMEDYEHDPEVLVQGVAANVNGGEWFDVGRITVRNKTATQAQSNPYALYTPYQLSQIRLQLVNPPYANLNAGASGLTTRDASFCATASWSASDRTLCFRRTPSSASQLGYASNLSALERINACQGRPGCPTLGPAAEQALYRYLVPGQQSVIIMSASVGVQSLSFTKNTICSYEGHADPIDSSGRVRSVVFGSISGSHREASNRAAGLRASNPGATWDLIDLRNPSSPSALVPADHAVLNCPYAQYGVASPRSVEAVALVNAQAFAPAVGGAITENANGCFVASGNTQKPCYEWMGGEASLDPFNGEAQMYKTLDIDTYHSFGFEACKPVAGQTGVLDCSDTSALRN